MLVLVVTLAVIAVLALAGGTGGVSGDDTDPSSRSAGAAGTLALYAWLGDLGLDVHRVSGDFDLSGTDLLVIVQPLDSMSADDVGRIDAFLRGGGEVVLALNGGTAVDAATPLLDHLHQAVIRSTPGGDAVPLQPLSSGDTVHHVTMAGNVLDLGTGEGAPLLAVGDTVVMRGYAVGDGRAYVMGSSYPLSNEGLRATRPDATATLQPTGSDAAALVLALVEHGRQPAGGTLRVGFDEVHHGEGPGGGASAIFGTVPGLSPLGLAAVLAAVCVLAYIAGSGRRMGRAVPVGDPAHVPSAGDFVRAMAQLFARSAQRGAVADRFAQELKDRVAAASGVDPRLDDAAFLAALQGYGEARCAEVAAALSRARGLAAGAPTEAQLLALVREVDDVESRWTAGAPA